MQKTFISKAFLLILLAGVIYVCYLIFKPFLGELFIATILVTIFYTPYEQLLAIFRGKKIITSLVMCLLIIILVIVPLTHFISYTAERLVETYNQAEVFVRQGGIGKTVEIIEQKKVFSVFKVFGISEDRAKKIALESLIDIKDWFLSEDGSMTMVNGAKNILAGTANFIVSIVIVFFCMFFFFMDGRKLAEKAMYLTPLSNKYDKAIFKKFKDVSSSTVVSTFLTAIAQGVIGGIGFLIVGFPVFFASIIMAFASIIPYVGTALVWLPVSLYLFATGGIWQGIFIIIWGAVIVGNSDNLIRAYLIKDKAEVHPLFVIFSIIGGLSLFGFWGIIFGPLVISLAVTLLHIYEMEYEDVLEK